MTKCLEGRLIQAANGTTTASYSYDHQGRRISKTVNGTTTKYKYDGWNVLREMNASDQTIAEYTYDQANRPVSMRRGGATYYYIYNARGDITAVVNTSGTIVNTYSYDPWGKILSASETVENPFRYASYRYDTETSLYYLQNRYYNPDIMRFISRDAIRDTVGSPSQSNYYHYADGNPIMKIDSDGNFPQLIAVYFWVIYFVVVFIPIYIRYQRQINWTVKWVAVRVRRMYRRVYWRWWNSRNAYPAKCH